MFKGSIPALITPFLNGRIDEDAFERLVDWQIREGSTGAVPVGTTGESPTVMHEEHKRIIEICVEIAKRRVPVIAGAGSNSTLEAISYAQHAKHVGADAVLVVMPYYNKPTQEGLFRHINAINESVDIPIVLYNVPSRTVSDMQVETMARCAKLKNVIGVKDATADMARASQQRQECGKDFLLLSGEDATALGFNAHGGSGCISVTANVAPRLCALLQNASLAGDFKTALSYQDYLMPLHKALFLETNPGPVKYACAKLGFGDGSARLPLAPISNATRLAIDAAMEFAELLPPNLS
ncbi:MAG: 4-hydroxy-tetrahydrodipicolinate synthase [Hyphomicrobiaceae bacterium]|nr:4-hydroxy-tetrahydrodipicolinate synthase [Hyphomicrobiaceae bacterium]